MHPPHNTVQQLAEAVADGTPVDWDHAESSVGSAAELDVVRQLRRLAGLADAARTQAATWGPLLLRGEVGHGTFGTVYRAWDPRLDREVALKLLPDTGTLAQPSTVVSEGKLLAAVRHPNVVTVFGADTFDGRVGIWMEFVTGRTLTAIVDEQGPFGAHEAAVIGRDVCRALAAVHQRGFVHRDVKAQNVMREAGGRTVLMDFGAGTALPSAAAAAPALSGTPAYLAPEVLAGSAPTAQSDLYSLGVLLFYLVSGGFPVVSTSLDDLRARHAARERRLLRDARPDLPAAFVRAVDAALDPDPAARPQSAGALEALLDETLVERPAAEMTGDRPSQPSWRAWTWAGAAATVAAIAAAALWATGTAPFGTPAVTRNAIAVLPWTAAAGAPGFEDITTGIAQDVARSLATLPGLRLVAGPQTAGYGVDDLAEMASTLNVSAALVGSVDVADERVLVVTRLLDVPTGEALWTGRFERDIRDLLSLQSEVARRVALALRGELTDLEEQRLNRGRSADPQAFRSYLRGRHAIALRTEAGLNDGIRHFQAAIGRDAAYALAHAGLAEAYVSLGNYEFLPRSEASARSAAAATRAIEIDPELAEAHVTLAYARKNRFEWAAAERAFTRAIELRPDYATAHHWYSIFLTQHGRFPEAIAEIRTAMSLDPLSIGASMQMASLLTMARRYEDAIAQYQSVLRTDPNLARPHRGIADCYVYLGLYDKARAALDEAARLTAPGADTHVFAAANAYLLAASGRPAEARTIAAELAGRFRRAGEATAGSVAAIHARLGENDTAIEWLGLAHTTGDAELGYLNVDPRWDPLREDPRFAALLTQLGFAVTAK